MKKADSLKRKKEFRYTYRTGKSQANRMFAVVYAGNRHRRTYLGFSVSKKIGNAVVRNRAKRRMREAATPLIPLLKQGYNVIVIARTPVVNASFEEICSNMRSAFERTGLICQ